VQTLGISDSTPQAENILKRLFWPSIGNGSDVDTLGSQGYWVCAIVAVFACLSSAATGHPIAGAFLLLFYYLGGVGVRQHSCYAAVIILVMFVADTVLSPGVLKFFGCVLMLSVLRATFIASFWERQVAEVEMPLRFSKTWGDKFAEELPAWLWPRVRIAYFIFSAGFLILTTVGVVMMALHGHA
jgi:hypothetical protein